MPPPAPPSSSSRALKFTEETVLGTLSSYSNDWARALEFYEYVTPQYFSHTPSTHSLILDILAKNLEFPRALSLLHSPLSPYPSLSSFRSLFNRLAAAHLVSDALDLFHLHSPRSLPTYHLLIDALSDHRHVDDAEHLALLSPNPPFPPDTKIRNMILRGWAKLRHWSRCRELWQQTPNHHKDLHSYAIYMDAMSKSGKPYKTLKLFKELVGRQLKPDVVIYNTVVQAAGLAHGADESVRMFRRMVDSGCPPNSVTFNILIKMLCREGRVREGYGFLSRMRKMGCEPDVITYHCFFQHCTRPNEILWLFERMVGSGCRPRMDTYVMLMKKFGRWGFLRPVFLIWGKMEEHGVSPDAFAYNAMIDALLMKGMVEEARRYDEEMLAKGLAAKPRKELGTKYLGGDDDGDDNAFSGVL